MEGNPPLDSGLYRHKTYQGSSTLERFP